MALVGCRECASEISDSAQTCPRRGVRAGRNDVHLRASRNRHRRHDVKIHVYVDGNFRGEVGPGAWIEPKSRRAPTRCARHDQWR